jgi:hypothetical protein
MKENTKVRITKHKGGVYCRIELIMGTQFRIIFPALFNNWHCFKNRIRIRVAKLAKPPRQSEQIFRIRNNVQRKKLTIQMYIDRDILEAVNGIQE